MKFLISPSFEKGVYLEEYKRLAEIDALDPNAHHREGAGIRFDKHSANLVHCNDSAFTFVLTSEKLFKFFILGEDRLIDSMKHELGA